MGNNYKFNSLNTTRSVQSRLKASKRTMQQSSGSASGGTNTTKAARQTDVKKEKFDGRTDVLSGYIFDTTTAR